MVINKYPYHKINKTTINGKRFYATESGPLASVTTILDRTKPQKSVNALNNWRNRVGHAEARKITNEAANVGSKMHEYLEQWVDVGDFTPGKTLPDIVSSRMANTVIENISPHIDEIWGSEVNLYYPGLYAGTTDLPGVWKGKPAIMDFKQTNRPKKREWIEDYLMQGAAYGMAHNILFGSQIETAAIFMCSRDCEFQLFEISGDEYQEYCKKWANRVAEFYELDK